MGLEWSHFLEKVLASDLNHYLWLRSISYLEYIGYRKMVKAVPYQEVEQGVFRHLSDEIQHSFMLKEMAQKTFEQIQVSQSTLDELVEISEEYFQGIDQMANEWVSRVLGKEDRLSCYVWVSYMIEKRAMQVYSSYLSRIVHTPLKTMIQKIIRDESEHLNYLENQIPQLPEALSPEHSPLLESEKPFFDQFLNRMKAIFQKVSAIPQTLSA